MLLRWSFSTDDAFFLPRDTTWVSRPYLTVPRKTPKKHAPTGSGARWAGFWLIFLIYSTFSVEIKALRPNKTAFLPCGALIFRSLVNPGPPRRMTIYPTAATRQ